MPFAIVPSVPHAFGGDPLPSDGWWLRIFTPVAHGPMTSVLSHEVKALLLSGKDVPIFGINCRFTFSVVSLIGVLVSPAILLGFCVDLVRRFVLRI